MLQLYDDKDRTKKFAICHTQIDSAIYINYTNTVFTLEGRWRNNKKYYRKDDDKKTKCMIFNIGQKA